MNSKCSHWVIERQKAYEQPPGAQSQARLYKTWFTCLWGASANSLLLISNLGWQWTSPSLESNAAFWVPPSHYLQWKPCPALSPSLCLSLLSFSPHDMLRSFTEYLLGSKHYPTCLGSAVTNTNIPALTPRFSSPWIRVREADAWTGGENRCNAESWQVHQRAEGQRTLARQRSVPLRPEKTKERIKGEEKHDNMSSIFDSFVVNSSRRMMVDGERHKGRGMGWMFCIRWWGIFVYWCIWSRN